MSESKHTPGPWTIERCGIDLPENDVLIVGHPNSSDMSVIRTIGRLFSYDRPEVNKANARLIAAAPELLDACKAQHEAIDRLFALLISHDSGFFPSKSGQPWQAILQGNAARAEAEKQA